MLLALIEVDRGVFSIDTADPEDSSRRAGVSDAVIVALIRSGRTAPPPDRAPGASAGRRPEPQPEPRARARR